MDKKKQLNLLRNIIDLRKGVKNPGSIVVNMVENFTIEEQTAIVDVCAEITAFYTAANVINTEVFNDAVATWRKELDEIKKSNKETVH